MNDEQGKTENTASACDGGLERPEGHPGPASTSRYDVTIRRGGNGYVISDNLGNLAVARSLGEALSEAEAHFNASV